MTNAEKYLKDRVSAEEFARIILEETVFDPTQEDIIAFLNKPCKPTLTEDERVILKFIENFDYIGRDEKGLYYKLQDVDIKEKTAVIYNLTTNLFQFIQERRRILY